MTVYESFSLMIMFAMLIIAVINISGKRTKK